MRQYRKIVNERSGQTIVARARICTGFFCRLRGLMLVSDMAEDEGIILERREEGRLHAGIHTLGMRFDIAVIWLDGGKSVVDMRKVIPWKAICVPKTRAKYVIETVPETLDRIIIGDRLIFCEVTP